MLAEPTRRHHIVVVPDDEALAQHTRKPSRIQTGAGYDRFVEIGIEP